MTKNIGEIEAENTHCPKYLKFIKIRSFVCKGTEAFVDVALKKISWPAPCLNSLLNELKLFTGYERTVYTTTISDFKNLALKNPMRTYYRRKERITVLSLIYVESQLFAHFKSIIFVYSSLFFSFSLSPGPTMRE